MKRILLFISLFLCTTQLFYAQEDGVVSFALPVRNSLKFNRYLINPTFSFVREQGSYISFYNKRQWVQFDDAPQTYLVGYSGRFKENEGIAIGFFQQNYGVLTTFGAVTNFAHNVVLDRDSNLTFGLNVGFYKSGLNSGKVITTNADPSLQNIPSSFLTTINPGINYGTEFLDFGVSVNNLILYNFKTSKIIQDNPERSIELHAMHTGYLDTYGFFDKSKFSALLKTELKKDKTIVSGLVMFATPNGIWAQAGYNTLYGMSAGLGLNISPRISIEYNFEKAMGNLSNFGSSHEITLAYRFKGDNYYNDDDDNEGALITPKVTRKYVASKPKTNTNTEATDKTKIANEARAKLIADAKIKADEKAKQIADAKNKVIADRAKLIADAKAKREAILQNRINNQTAIANKTKTEPLTQTKAATTVQNKPAVENKAKTDPQAKLITDQKAKTNAIAQTKPALENKAKTDPKAKTNTIAQAKPAVENKAKTDTQTKLLADEKAKAKADALAQAKLAAENKAKTDAKTKLPADEKAKTNALAQAKLAAENKAKADAQAKLLADEKAKADALAQAKLAAENKAKADAQAKLLADEKAKSDALAQAKLATENKAKADAQAKLLADEKAKADALAQAKLAAENKAKADAQAKLLADEKAKSDALAQTKLAAENKAKADAQAKLLADEKAKADALAQAKLAAENKAKADAQAKLLADEKAKTDALAQAKLAAENKAKADAQAKLLADAKAKADSIAQAKLAISPNDELAKSMENLINLIKEFKTKQLELLKKLDGTVSNKEKDLKDLKEENDLSEKGIFTQPKPFKSVTAENNALFSLNSEIDQLIKTQKDKITELENLYKERLKKGHNKTDEASQHYLQSIESLKDDQTKLIQTNTKLLTSLEEIKKETEIEKKRRIKRASFENDDSRYLKDLEALKRIKETTPVSKNNFKPEDFDYGDEQANMQILKKIKNTDAGYYLIIAVHNDSSKRDEFLTKTVSAGQKDINFFYDVNTSKYFIYYNRFDNIEEAKRALSSKGSTPYNGKMIIVKVEN
ncbi:type IX secretion system membrane protein PorP/SprF [Flavobacterium sufflavum]|uniref:Type IX secretion system membrane protein PorP/SprF n=1 Tax=Flavobacterium sufflavum TaxID=1921138 RepID=A0A437L3K9_9FLAO|nr:PorP/SprF family type IX secretion system membrane protein [Flavobacterium sufflavum]RVT79892.1 type IX secretion system membrane protein PorP/SprF [Flavobacterium sufflavum]